MIRPIFFFFAFFFLHFATFSQSVKLDSGLVAFYSFDNSFSDMTGRGHDGTGYNLTFQPGHCGNPNSAIFLNGVTSYMEVADHQELRPSQISFAFWTNISSNDYPYVLFGKSVYTDATQEQYALAYNYYKVSGADQRSVGFHFSVKEPGYCNSPGQGWDPTVYTQQQQPANTWLFVVALFDGSYVKIYVNGTLIGQAPDSYNTIANCAGGTFRIGKWWQNYQTPFYGLIDDFRIYNRALNLDEINKLSTECPLTTSLEDAEKEATTASLQLYPNPASTGTVMLQNKSLLPLSAKLYNDMGHLLQEITVEPGTTSLSLIDYPNGIYFLKTDQQVLKLMKQ